MKKVFLVVATVALVASFTSCSKKCICTTYALGVQTTKTEVDLKDSGFDKCADMTTITDALGGKTGMECK